MASRCLIRILLVLALLLSGGLSTGLREVAAVPNKFDIGSGGMPTMTGNSGGFVTANASLLADLVVTINFGELSPANQSGVGTIPLVKVVVPIAIRSTAAYELNMTVSPSGALSADANAVQLTDIGFGIRNLRPLGIDSTVCGGNSTVVSPFSNDPSQTVSLNGTTARAVYPSTLNSVGGSSVVMFGPQLSLFRNVPDFKRSNDNGWLFDAIFTIAPQYYSSGSVGPITLTFRITAASSCACPCN